MNQQTDQEENPEDVEQEELESVNGEKAQPSWGTAGEAVKYTAILAIMLLAIRYITKKLSHFSFDEVVQGLTTIPSSQIALAAAITAVNFVVLTGYDWIAVHYLKKKLPLRKIMIGAIVGYAASNIFGWMFGGTAVRFRLYSRWGFRISEVIAFISVLSVTFWLGMFLLAGIAFVSLPVHLPKDYQEKLIIEPRDYGYAFLFIVLVYLLATMFVHKPIRIPFSTQKFSFPPFRLSLLQLAVSASDFALASCVLYVLLPTGEVNYATVLVSYLAAMIIVVILHVPGGIGVLELVVMELLAKDRPETDALHIQVMSGLILFRLIYYILPAIPAALLYLFEEISWSRSHRKD